MVNINNCFSGYP